MYRIASALVAALITAGGLQSWAQGGAADFYAGTTIRFVVPYGPGGGFDQYARMLAPHLERKTGATVVVENRPGGAGMTAINQVSRGKPDGTTIAIMSGVPAALGQILEAPAVQFDLTKLPFLARINAEPWVLLLSAKSGHKSLQDLIKASQAGEVLTFAGLGRADGPTDAAAVVCAALDLNCRLVVGFKGSSEVALSAIRGDVTGFAVTDRSGRDYSQGGDLIPVAIIGRERSELLPDTPTIFEAAQIPKDKTFWIDFRGSIVDVGRTVITVPGTPQERIAYLRQIFDQILTDPAIVAEGERKGLPISFASGAEVEKIVKRVLDDIPDDRLAAIRDVLLRKYF